MIDSFDITRAHVKEILEALLAGPKTFGELAKLVNVHTLQRRLKELIVEGAVCREVLEDRRVRYKLTLKGLEVAFKVATAGKSFSTSLKRLMGRWYDDFLREWTTYWEKRDEILREYKGKYVSIYKGDIIAVGDDLPESVSKAKERCGERFVLTVKVGEELKPFRIRSPKLRKRTWNL